MLNVERLRYLHAVATHGSVAAAANALHVTPSGISQQLGKLARETGHELYEPNGRGIRLTHAGRVLADHAAGVLRRIDQAERALDELREQVAGPVRIGAFSTATMALLPPTFARLRERHPELAPMLRESEADATLAALVNDELDVGVLESFDNLPTPLPAGVTHRELARDEAQIALPSGHPLAGRDVLDIGEVRDMPWASWNSGTACHQWLLQTLRSQDLEPRIVCRVSTCPSILGFVQAGVAAALLCEMGHTPLPDGVVLIPSRPALRRTIVAAWRADAERPVIRASVDTLAEAAGDVIGGR